MKRADAELAAIGSALSVFLYLPLQQRRPKRSWPHGQPPGPPVERWTRSFTWSYLLCAPLR